MLTAALTVCVLCAAFCIVCWAGALAAASRSEAGRIVLHQPVVAGEDVLRCHLLFVAGVVGLETIDAATARYN